MPSRRDVDPTEIPWALSRIFLVDYSAQDGFRYRLAGSEIASAFGRANMKGLLFSGFLPPERARFVEERWLPLVPDRCIVVMTGMIHLAEIGRASCRERVCQYLLVQVVPGTLKKKK